jgi:hypothetical protein
VLQICVNPYFKNYLKNVTDDTALLINFTLNEPTNNLSLPKDQNTEISFIQLKHDGLVLSSNEPTEIPIPEPKLAIDFEERKIKEKAQLKRAFYLVKQLKPSLKFGIEEIGLIQQNLWSVPKILAEKIGLYLGGFMLREVAEANLNPTDLATIIAHQFSEVGGVPFQKLPSESLQIINATLKNELYQAPNYSITLNNEAGTKSYYYLNIENGEIGLYEKQTNKKILPGRLCNGKLTLKNNAFIVDAVPMRYAELWSDVFIHVKEANNLNSQELIGIDELVDDFSSDVSEFYITAGKPYGELSNYSGLVVKGSRESLAHLNDAIIAEMNEPILKLLEHHTELKDFIKIVNHPTDSGKVVISCKLKMNSGAVHHVSMVMVMDQNSEILQFIRDGINLNKFLPILLRHGAYIENPESKNLLDQEYNNHQLVVIDGPRLEIFQSENNEPKNDIKVNNEFELVAEARTKNYGAVVNNYSTVQEVFPLSFLK